MKLKLLGFCGSAGHGKTTAACAIVGHYPGWYRVSFADPLRAMLSALGLTSEELTLRKEEACALLGGKTPRYAMQTLGTEWGRGHIDGNLWMRAAQHKALSLIGNGLSVVFDDVRFDNEARMIRALGGQVVRVRRPGLGSAMAHASELGISEELIDHTITAEDVGHLRTGVFTYLNRFAK
jgi:hypothetical protein